MDHLAPTPTTVTLSTELVPHSNGVPAASYPEIASNGPSQGFQPEQLSDPESGGIVEYWRILRRHQGTLLLVTCLGLLGAILVTLPQTPIYRARTAVEIQDINNDFLNSKQVSPVTEGGNNLNQLTDVQTQIKILGSEHLVDRVVDKLKAAKKLSALETESGRISAWRAALRLKPPAPKQLDYQLRKRAENSLKVRQLGQTRIVEVLYDSTDPEFAADFANNLTAEFIESNMEARWKMSQHTGEWLSRQLDDMRINLERSEDALQQYARKSGLLFTQSSNTGDSTNVVDEKLRQIQEELSKAQGDRVSAQSRYEIAKSASPDTLADVLNDGSLRNLQDKLTELRRQQAELITVFTAKHEKVKRVDAQIAPLRTEFERERSAILDRIHNDYQTALRREKLLLADYANQSHVVTDQAEKAIQYNILKREVDSNRQLYESMLQQVKQASVASAMRASNVRIVDPAKVPQKRYSPDYLINSAIGSLAGLLLGVAIVIVRERANRTIQQPGDGPYWMNVPELGIIPSASRGGRARIDYNKSSRGKEAEQPQKGAASSTSEYKADVELITWNHKPSLVAESFRALLTSILFSGENGSMPRLLVLTSGSPTEGKTTVVSNLAIAMAEINRKVLIIDADLRRPRMHTLFDLNNDRGLSTILQDRNGLAQNVDALIQETSVPGLSVLTSGPSTHAAANLLYSTSLPTLLAKFKRDYDTVLIDTPPMLQMTDARLIGRMADGVILVTRANQTTREAAIAAGQRFAEDRIHVLGTILNDWNPKMSPGGYYGYYNGRYGGYRPYYRYQSDAEATAKMGIIP